MYRTLNSKISAKRKDKKEELQNNTLIQNKDENSKKKSFNKTFAINRKNSKNDQAESVKKVFDKYPIECLDYSKNNVF